MPYPVHGVAIYTNLVVRARAVTMACGMWRAVVATAHRSRATVGFCVPIGPSLGSRADLLPTYLAELAELAELAHCHTLYTTL